jgi:poly(hydroxyalkanoate) depolymerase family esterase
MSGEALPVLGDPEPAGIAAMEIFYPPRGAFRITLCHAIAIALSFVTFASASAAEPRAETGFGSNPGNLRMFSYAPAGVKTPAPLVVVLHGCKQKAATFARDAGWLDLAESANITLLLPEQKGLNPFWYDVAWVAPLVTFLGANNQNACFNWFEPGDTARDRGEALSIVQMIDAMIARYPVDRSRVYIVGLSAGGAMTAAMLAAYPERFAGGAIVAGVPHGCADNVARALQCMNPGVDRTPEEWRAAIGASPTSPARYPPVSIWHGDADVRVVPRNRVELVEQWTAAHGLAGVTPNTLEANEILTREIYADANGSSKVESVLVKGLGHAFPIRVGGSACGRPGDFVVDAKVCGATEIARFWGLTGN